MLNELGASLLMAALSFVAYIGTRPEKASACPMRCWRHQNRPRVHVPCERCRDRHP